METSELGHWPGVARIQFTGPYNQKTTVVFVPIGETTTACSSYLGTFAVDACLLDVHKALALIDSDCAPVTFFELEALWNFSS